MTASVNANENESVNVSVMKKMMKNLNENGLLQVLVDELLKLD